MTALKIIGLCFASILLAQCNLLAPAPYPTKTIYEIAPPSETVSLKKIHKTLFVAPMQTYAGFDSSKMKYVIYPYQVGYFTKNRWIASPTTMLQPILLSHLQSRFVKTTQQSSEADITIKTTLIRFEQVFCDEVSQFHLTMQVEMIDDKTHRVLALKTLRIIEPTFATPYGGAIAANRAVQLLLKHIDTTVLSHV